ncbi:MAG: STAS/SEC14 domain-containing protein [Bacteroidota bacterium]|nr:STAS/SEC14 domain-containing protein [Bacteroidota bacterium]
MIEVINGLPQHVAAFRATGLVSREDYQKLINPIVKKIVTTFGKVNYMLVLQTPLKNYTLSAWIEDASLGLRHLSKWKKIAIVSDKQGIVNFTNTFGKLNPGETRGFRMEDLGLAEQWVSDM